VLMPDWMASIANDRIVVRALTLEELVVTRLLEPGAEAEPQPIEFEFPRLPVRLQVHFVRAGRFRLDDLADEWAPAVRGSAFWGQNEFRVRDLRLEAPNYRVTSPQLQLRLGGDQPIAGRLAWQLFDETYAGEALIGGNLRTLELDHRLTAPFAVDATGTLRLVGALEPTIDLDLEAPELALERITAENLEASVRGTLWRYTGEVRGQLDVDGRASGPARVAFAGHREGIVVAPATFVADIGTLVASGPVRWVPELDAELVVQAIDVDPARLGAPHEGDLELDAVVRYHAGQLSVRMDDLHGTYAGRDFSAIGDLRIANGIVSGENLQIRSGENRIHGTARYGEERIEADLELALPEPHLLIPEVSGDLHGEIRVQGPLDDLVGSARLTSASLAWEDLQVRNLRLDAERQPDGQRNRIELAAAHVGYVELELRDVTVSGAGDDVRGQVDLTWRFFDEAPSRVRAALERRDDGVAATVAQGTAVATPYGDWRLDSDVDVDLAGERLGISAHCWARAGGAGRVCLDHLRRVGMRTEVAGAIVELPLQWVHVFFEGIPQFAGQFDATWDLTHDADAGTIHGHLGWGTADLGLTEFAEGDDDAIGRIDLPDLTGYVEFAGNRLSATLFADLDDERVIDVNLRISDLAAERRLGGRAMLSLPDLSFIATMLEQVGSFEGALVGELEFAGTVEDPRIGGQLELVDGSMAWLDPYVELEQLTLVARMDEPGLISVTGSAASDRRGQLMLDASITRPFTDDRAAVARVHGRDVEVQIPDSRLWIAPDIVMTWHAQRASFTGTIELPRAQLVAPELPEAAVTRSSDVVVIGRDEEAVADPLRFTADMRLVIGDEVHLIGFGLTAQLGGNLRLVRTIDGVTELHGRVDIRSGQFSAYGQTLEIDAGNLTFAGPPANPFVNARAVRRIERADQEITVGIVVTGEVDDLESTLFSDPTMSEGNALSYLMLGRPLRDSTPGEGDELVGAAVALGLRQAAPLIEEVGRTLGLDEFAAVGDDTDDLTVIAGKQLTSRLFVRYTYQAFLGVSAMTLRYELTDRLSLETTASDTPGVDIMYRVTE
jgi:translocation and assembly module TamB